MRPSIVLHGVRSVMRLTPTKGRTMRIGTEVTFERTFDDGGNRLHVAAKSDGVVRVVTVSKDGHACEVTFTQAEWDALVSDLRTIQFIAQREVEEAQPVTQQLDDAVRDVAQEPVEPEWLSDLPVDGE